MTGPGHLPSGLPEPVDDGACDHLTGLELPSIRLLASDGQPRSLRGVPSRWLVMYVYPRTGGPDVELPADWDLIPGARGCTPQACDFRDHHAVLAARDATVWGVSAQPPKEQEAFARRMHLPMLLLNDAKLLLAAPPLKLPTFTAGGLTLYKRLTLVAERGTITRVFYPVFPPDRNAAQVLEYLEDAGGTISRSPRASHEGFEPLGTGDQLRPRP